MIDKKQAQENGFKIIESNQTLSKEKNEKLEQLKKLIPNLVNSDNQVDTNALQDFIDIAQTTSNNKGYELTFAGKGIARAKADSETPFELQFEPEQSKNMGENVVIRGDNLEVLKILKQNYFEKIKMIYIDPPYNTKSENFVYNDNFKQSEENLINDFGLDEDTTDFLHNVYGTKSHSGWLAFMYPRLKLARDLLRDDGVIFISIDDNEQANLKIICDEIFGEDNFVEIFKWNKTSTPPSLSNKVRGKYEFVLCYEKQSSNNIFNGGVTQGGDMPLLNESNSLNTLIIPKENVKFNFSGEFENKIYDRVELLESLKIKNGYADKDIKLKGKFKWSQQTINKEIENGTIFIIKTEKFAIRYIRLGERIKKPADVISKIECDVGTNEDANKEQKGIFNDIVLFDNPKPTTLIKYLTSFICNKNDIILDFFAGSGTTGDAVMQLNREDEGTRKFILVQWDEAIKENTEAYKFCVENKLEPVISSITIERLNRAGEKLKTEMAGKLDFDNKKLDIGYKVFSLTEKPKLAEDENGLFAIDNQRSEVKDSSVPTKINTLYNMICATGKPLHTKIETIIKDKIYKADDDIYILGEIETKDLERYKESQIFIDGWADISLEHWLNMEAGQKETVVVVY